MYVVLQCGLITITRGINASCVLIMYVTRHVLANILRWRYVARMPPLEARSPRCRSNAENAPSTASHRPASHAHLRYTARNVENASVTRPSRISNARTPRVN